jgi:APA family basic amino acid/polyamine antiporter
VSIAGILNGWLLVAGRLPYAAARDGFAPAWMARVHPRFGTPAVGLAVSSAVTAVLIVLYFVRTLLEAYNFVALFATSTALFAILAACVAEIVLIRREPERFSTSARRRGPYTAAAGSVIVLILIAGAGFKIAALSLACLVVPIGYHLYRRGTRPAGA